MSLVRFEILCSRVDNSGKDATSKKVSQVGRKSYTVF